jgi:carbon-monoxide dehydrogenase iron sulfur subunit
MTELHGPFIMVDPDRCVGCHSCELACAVAHTRSGTLFGAVLAGEPLTPRNRVVAVADVRFPTQCRQCEDAPCVKVCPTGATFRTESYTAVNPNRCIACGLCSMVCPFGAIHISSVPVNGKTKRAASKCDLCVDRPGGPACVEACPTKALTLAQPEDVMEAALKTSAERFLEALESQKQQERRA